MIAWLCKCGSQIKQDKKPDECLLCKGHKFKKISLPDPSKEDEENKKKYDEVIEKLDEYTENCEPQTIKTFCEK